MSRTPTRAEKQPSAMPSPPTGEPTLTWHFGLDLLFPWSGVLRSHTANFIYVGAAQRRQKRLDRLEGIGELGSRKQRRSREDVGGERFARVVQ